MKKIVKAIEGLFKQETNAAPKSAFIMQVEQMLDQYERLFEDGSPYVLNNKLTRAQVEQFEAMANIALPADYKEFLLHIGDGAVRDRQFPLSLSHARDCLETSIRNSAGFEYMSLPFSVESCNCYYGEEFDEIDDDISDEELDKIRIEAAQGVLTVHDDGCGYYIVLVVAGDLKGKLYYIDTCHGQGAHLVSDSFSEYYLKWLNRKITERLAFLEQHDKFECVITHVKLGGNVRDLHVRNMQNDFSFQFEFFCPGDFVREGGHTEYTKVDDQLVVSLSMEHKSYSPLVLEKLEESFELDGAQSLTLMGDRSVHTVIGHVNRLFEHSTGENCFPLYVEGLEQEILIKAPNDLTVSVGDVYKVTGQLNGEVYRIMRYS